MQNPCASAIQSYFEAKEFHHMDKAQFEHKKDT